MKKVKFLYNLNVKKDANGEVADHLAQRLIAAGLAEPIKSDDPQTSKSKKVNKSRKDGKK